MGLAVNRSYRRLVFLFFAAHHDLRFIVRAQVVISSATIAGLTLGRATGAGIDAQLIDCAAVARFASRTAFHRLADAALR